MTSEINPLFVIYLSLLSLRSSQRFPDLVALWQLAPVPIEDTLPFTEVLVELQQRVEDLKADAYCLLSDPHFQAAVGYLKNPPLMLWADKNGSRVAFNPEALGYKPYTQLQVAAEPRDWLLAKLKIPFKLHSFRSRVVTEDDEEGEKVTVYRSILLLALGEIEVEVSVDTYHRYKSYPYDFDLKRQQEEIAQQLSMALQGIENQLIEEASCLCCYGFQILALAKTVQAFHAKVREFQKNQDTLEV